MDTAQLNYYPTKYMYCHSDGRSLEVHWRKNIPADKIDVCLDHINSMVSIMKVKRLLIDGVKLKSSDFGLNWKLIERSWKSFHDNGGKKIVILKNDELPDYLLKEYLDAVHDYELPVKIEFLETHK